jgi:hypothetical protein
MDVVSRVQAREDDGHDGIETGDSQVLEVPRGVEVQPVDTSRQGPRGQVANPAIRVGDRMTHLGPFAVGPAQAQGDAKACGRPATRGV